MKIYLSGPMRGKKDYNFPEFDRVTKILRSHGHDIISPAEADREEGHDPISDPEGYEKWVKSDAVKNAFERDIRDISSCDAIYMLDGWENSIGATAEKAVAVWMMKTVMYKTGPEKAKPTEMRAFGTGATRDSVEGKYDYEGFLSPLVLERFGEYMNKHRKQANGELRDSDNWQKGIPKDVYIKSLWRHFMDLWMMHRGHYREDSKDGHEITFGETLCAIMFNAMGYLHETLKEGANEI